MENKTERSFLHDIATPMAIAQAMVQDTLELLNTKPNEHAEEIMRLEKALKSLDKLVALLRERRDAIVGAPSA
jgi:phosphate uptake regulator